MHIRVDHGVIIIVVNRFIEIFANFFIFDRLSICCLFIFHRTNERTKERIQHHHDQSV